MSFRLVLSDESLFPIQSFFNAVSDDSFVQMIDLLTSGVGYASDVCCCRFPGDLDPDEELFDGVEFSIFEQNVVISTEELGEYLRLVCNEFVEKFPNERERINHLLARH